jgi:hypothetical protein
VPALSWKPKLLTSPEARERADLELVRKDLLYAKATFARLAQNPHGVIKLGLMRSPADDPTAAAWVEFVAASLAYRSCFKSGVRVRLEADLLPAVWTPDQLSLHEALLDIVDKHIAHSVNGMELLGTTLEVAIDDTGKVHRGSIGWRGAGIGAFGPVGFDALAMMVETLVGKVVDVRVALLERALKAQVEAMTDEEVLALPDGFPPTIEIPDFRRPRTWPPRH